MNTERKIHLISKSNGYQVQINNILFGANNISISRILENYYGIKNPTYSAIYKNIEYDNKNSNIFIDNATTLTNLLKAISNGIYKTNAQIKIINEQIKELGLNIEEIKLQLKNEIIENVYDPCEDNEEYTNRPGNFYYEYL